VEKGILMVTLQCESYADQLNVWPDQGRHILAQYDDERVVIYQAYRPSIGHYAASHGHFGGEFSFSRMSWIKPNFLWMMYRSGWGTKQGQEVTLAVFLKRTAFDEILAQAVHSGFVEAVYGDRGSWQQKVKESGVRLQWDPDHAPNGAKVERRAIQLGLRGEVLKKYAQEWIIAIEDLSQFVSEQRENIGKLDGLITPRERVYPVKDAEVARKLRLNELKE
jgi:hypothetical protein